MEFDDGEPVPEIEGIPLAEDAPAEPSRPKAASAKNTSSNDPTVTLEEAKKSGKAHQGKRGRRRRRLPPRARPRRRGLTRSSRLHQNHAIHASTQDATVTRINGLACLVCVTAQCSRARPEKKCCHVYGRRPSSPQRRYLLLRLSFTEDSSKTRHLRSIASIAIFRRISRI